MFLFCSRWVFATFSYISKQVSNAPLQNAVRQDDWLFPNIKSAAFFQLSQVISPFFYSNVVFSFHIIKEHFFYKPSNFIARSSIRTTKLSLETRDNPVVRHRNVIPIKCTDTSRSLYGHPNCDGWDLGCDQPGTVFLRETRGSAVRKLCTVRCGTRVAAARRSARREEMQSAM